MPEVIVRTIDKFYKTIAVFSSSPEPAPADTRLLVTLKHNPGMFLVVDEGVSKAGDQWISAVCVLPIGRMYIVGSARRLYWYSEVSGWTSVPVSAVA